MSVILSASSSPLPAVSSVACCGLPDLLRGLPLGGDIAAGGGGGVTSVNIREGDKGFLPISLCSPFVKLGFSLCSLSVKSLKIAEGL